MASMKSLLETGEPITVTDPVKQKPANAFSSVPITISGFAFGEYSPPERLRPGPGQPLRERPTHPGHAL
jgi:hypothetical protein